MWDLSPSGWNKEIEKQGKLCCHCSRRLQQAQRHNIEIKQDAAFLDNFPKG